MTQRTGLTLARALTLAEAHWESKGASSRMMSTRAKRCVAVLGEAVGGRNWERYPTASVTATHATKLLTRLRDEGLSKASVQSYYAAFRAMLKLNGVSTDGWPAPGNPPRRTREPIRDEDLVRLEAELRRVAMVEARRRPRMGWFGRASGTGKGPQGDGYNWRTGRVDHGDAKVDLSTVDLLILLKGTGMRVDVEALSWDSWTWGPQKRILRIIGKGENERAIPVEDAECVSLLGDPARLAAMRRLSYSGHLKRWNAAVRALGIDTKKPTPHAVRHWWATRLYHASEKDLRLVQQLLGHADVNTTARYIGVDVEQGREAVKAMAGEAA